MAAVQLPLTQPHNNQQLFSDYFLNETLPKQIDWQALTSEARSVMEKITAIWQKFEPSGIEAQTERDFVQPVLDVLGHTYEVQASLRTPDGTKTPDYVFYRDQASQTHNKNKVLTDELLQSRAFAVGDAKHWDRKLDTTIKGSTTDPFTNKNPSYQISFYMQHSGLEWGILTNGRLWRLYHRDSAHKLDRFYEVDLPALLALGDVENFLYFYVFFRRATFEPHALGVGKLLRASIDYAQGVSDTLKVQVFDALRHLAQGFLDDTQNRLETDPETLAAIYDNSLIVLYRMLFILYAEARGLLPVRESDTYRESYSMQSITHQIGRDLKANRLLLNTSVTLWPRLTELFNLIDEGNPLLKVATFNGGLFDPVKHPFLEQYRVGDAHLRHAIDILARVNGQFVDYRDLAEQHLGTIYEGLLEYHLTGINPEAGWTVDIVNDKGERKATGSYYTPNYIVKYIVDQTVGPLLRDAVDGKKTDAEKISAVLSLNIVDPAMGSGYFLVEATEYMARFLVDLAVVPEGSGEDEPDLAYWKRRVVQSSIYGVDLNPLAVDLAKLSLWLSTVAKDHPLSFLDHHLRTGNSLVGGWVSDLQLQSNKSTKRRSATKRAQQAEAAGQLSMLQDDTFRRSMSVAVDTMWLIEGTPGDTIEDVKKKEQAYAGLRENLTRKYGQLADLVTATHFGVEIDPTLWVPLADYATGRAITAPPQLIRWIEEASAIAEHHHFFHWELEFPEVFFDRRGEPLKDQAGFDAVVGNPPYIRQERLASSKPYFQDTFDAYQSTADLYLYFYEQGVKILRDAGRMGYITSGTFARGNFATAFRQLLPTIAEIETIIDFGENQPFKGAEMVRPSIFIMTKREQEREYRYLLISGKIPPSLDIAIADDGIDCRAETLESQGWTFQSVRLTDLLKKVFAAGPTLESMTDGRIYRGLITGLNDAFILDPLSRDRLVKSDVRCGSLIKPMVSGENLRPWYQEDEGKWVIVIPSGWTRQTFGEGITEEAAWNEFARLYPSLAEHLLPHADAARKRQDKGDYWWELRPCEYYAAFDGPKIIWPDIAKLPRYSIDDAGKYTNNTAYFIPDADPYLLGVLQSRVLWFATSQIAQPLRLRAGLWQYRFFRQFLNQLPIPIPSTDDRATVGTLATELSAQASTRYELGQSVRHRIQSDLGTPDKKLNQKLTAWWELDFTSFRTEINKVFKREIPVAERDEWEVWLATQQAEHYRLTAEIIRLETELNECVYRLFDLTPEEIQIIEASTKYEYGEV